MFERESGPRMVNHNKIKFARQLVNGQVAKFVQGAFFPADANARMRFLVALRGCHQRRERAAVVPRDAGELYRLAQALSRIAASLFTLDVLSRRRLTARIVSQRFVCADSQAASMISI